MQSWVSQKKHSSRFNVEHRTMTVLVVSWSMQGGPCRYDATFINKERAVKTRCHKPKSLPEIRSSDNAYSFRAMWPCLEPLRLQVARFLIDLHNIGAGSKRTNPQHSNQGHFELLAAVFHEGRQIAFKGERRRRSLNPLPLYFSLATIDSTHSWRLCSGGHLGQRHMAANPPRRPACMSCCRSRKRFPGSCQTHS